MGADDSFDRAERFERRERSDARAARGNRDDDVRAALVGAHMDSGPESRGVRPWGIHCDPSHGES